MRINQNTTVLPPSGLEESSRLQQQTSVLSSSTKVQGPTALAGDTYALRSLTAAPTSQGYFGSGENPLQSRPVEVLGGALMASMDQTGLRQDLPQLQVQIITSLLQEVLKQLQSVVSQLAQQLQGTGTPPQAGGGYGGGAGPSAPPYGSPTPGGSYPPPAGGPVVSTDVPVGYAPSGTLPVPTDPSEFASYISAATRQGQGQNGNIAQKDALPGTRFGQVVDAQLYDAAVARSYAYQFASSAKGYSPSTADGLADGANAFYRMSPSAQAFMQVASIYKGDLEGGAKNYDNGKLKTLLTQAGYPGAHRPGVGNTDIETLGAVADALDTGVLSLDDVMQSGAIQDMGKYQRVINFVQGGKFAELVGKYDSTPAQGLGNGLPPGGTGSPMGGVAGFYRDVVAAKNAGVGGISTGVSYQSLSNAERNVASGMDEHQRAVLHLWGIQMGAAGHQDGGVLLNVLNNPSGFKPAEVELAKELAAREQAMYGGITGKSLDQAFFGLYQQLTGKDISQRYGNAPVRFAQGPVNMDNRLTGANGLNQFENEVLQLWGHSPLFNGGKIDGSILGYAMNSNNRMEVNLNQQDLQALWDADLASDGVINGDSLENAMVDVLDRVYLGAPSASVQRTMNDALEEASLRRQGVLPPSDRPAASAASIDAIAASQARRTGGSCPFISQGA